MRPPRPLGQILIFGVKLRTRKARLPMRLLRQWKELQRHEVSWRLLSPKPLPPMHNRK